MTMPRAHLVDSIQCTGMPAPPGAGVRVLVAEDDPIHALILIVFGR